MLLLLFAFLAGIVTILSPCILPLLPIILSSVDDSGKQRPIGVVIGFVASFTFFTLFLSTIVRLSGIPPATLRIMSIFIVGLFGASMLSPRVQTVIEQLFSRLANLTPSGQKQHGLLGGLVIGLSLGLLWTPCVGPILAAVISLAIAGTVTAQSALITFAYALGTALPMFAILLAGSTALQKVPWLVKHAATIQKTFGVVMILTALAMALNVDRQFQSFVLTQFPNYGRGLTKVEENPLVTQQLTSTSQLQGTPAPELIVGGQWFNSPPLTLAQLRGKVVLVDFWTYSCINCQRTLPYLKKWWDSYKEQGLVIIGVHAPEFTFEKDAGNVQRALKDFDINYPVMQDNDFATWRAYNNNYWPAKYLIDKNGNIRATHFGEGEYDQTETMIQQLLKETGATITQSVDNPNYQVYARTPELYLGSKRIGYLASPEKITPNRSQQFSLPATLEPNAFAYQGNWTIMPEYAAPGKGAQLQLNFNAKAVYLVARPKLGSASTSGQMKIFLDNKLHASGADTHNGIVSVTTDRLYTIIQLDQPGQHVLRIEFQDDNVEVYAMTFG